jgi:hypothetical protein
MMAAVTTIKDHAVLDLVYCRTRSTTGANLLPPCSFTPASARTVALFCSRTISAEFGTACGGIFFHSEAYIFHVNSYPYLRPIIMLFVSSDAMGKSPVQCYKESFEHPPETLEQQLPTADTQPPVHTRLRLTQILHRV